MPFVRKVFFVMELFVYAAPGRVHRNSRMDSQQTDTWFDHMTCDVLSMFKVKRSKIKVTR